jgi:hypothetical protein
MAMVIDVYSRRVADSSIRKLFRTELILEAPGIAPAQRHDHPMSFIILDSACQYTSCVLLSVAARPALRH